VEIVGSAKIPGKDAAGLPLTKERRLHTKAGDFVIPSFDYLALAEWQPLSTQPGVLMARPEMMALANILHHPEISDKLIAETPWKRSNKDLRRVLALAHLTLARDRRDGTTELGVCRDTGENDTHRIGLRTSPVLTLHAGSTLPT